MVRNVFVVFAFAGLILSSTGCKKCVDCRIEHFDDFSLIAEEKGICGTKDELANEEEKLSVAYRCVQCVVFTGLGPQDTGILCGSLEYTDSIEQSNIASATEIGASVTCEFFTDTLIIVCNQAS